MISALESMDSSLNHELLQAFISLFFKDFFYKVYQMLFCANLLYFLSKARNCLFNVSISDSFFLIVSNVFCKILRVSCFMFPPHIIFLLICGFTFCI